MFHVNHLLPLSMVIFIWEVLIDLIREIVSKNYELPVCIFVKFKERSFIVLVSLISEQFEFFHKMLKETKQKIMSLIAKKNGFLCKVLFPIKASVLFTEILKSVWYIKINSVSSPIRSRVLLTGTLMRTWYRTCVRRWQSGTVEPRSETATQS